ncbi:MAG: CRTAC1 family protein [Planctomycetota bacterium]|jgi:hypothetical protein
MSEQRIPPEPQGGEQELVPADDTVIGRAFRWSLLVMAVIAAAAALTVWLVTRPDTAPPPAPAPPVQAITRRSEVQPPTVVFTDITAEAGIDFVHTNGAAGDKLLPETMGGGCAFFDADADGDQDLLLVNSSHWPDSAAADGPAPTMALYRNDGAGSFEDVTAASGLNVGFYGMGAAVGDYDNDGDVDLFVSAVGPNHLFRNDDGRFVDVTGSAGVAGAADEWSTGSGFLDFDGDGDLDLFVGNYVRWSKQIDFAVDYRLTGLGRAYGPPMNFEGAYPYLYRNEGNGTFTDVSAASGLHVTNPATGVPVAKALGVTFVDVGGDGRIDVFVANDTVRNFLFRNAGDGSFDDVANLSGAAYDSRGAATGAMGIDGAYYRNDEILGFGIGNFANEMTSLYVSQGRAWQFADESIGEGLGAPSRLHLSFGLFFFDYDLDGRLDLLQANGHLEDEINAIQPSQHYRQPAQLFWNAGTEGRFCFVEADRGSVGDLSRPIVGRGAAYADIDDDGDLDVLLTQVGGRPMLLRNDQELGHHWLRVKLRGKTSNRDAIGAWVELTRSNGVIQRRQVMPTRSYLSQVELPVTFGLGAEGHVETIRVTWPDGSTQDVPVTGVDTTIVVEQSMLAP